MMRELLYRDWPGWASLDKTWIIRINHPCIWEWMDVTGRGNCKTLRWILIWHVGVAVRRPVWLGHSEQGREWKGSEIWEIGFWSHRTLKVRLRTLEFVLILKGSHSIVNREHDIWFMFFRRALWLLCSTGTGGRTT